MVNQIHYDMSDPVLVGGHYEDIEQREFRIFSKTHIDIGIEAKISKSSLLIMMLWNKTGFTSA